MNKEDKKLIFYRLASDRAVALLSVLFLFCITVYNFWKIKNGLPCTSLLPGGRVTMMSIHITSLLGSVVYLLTGNFVLFVVIMQVESITAILSSFEALGIIFFYGTIFLVQLKKYKAKNIRQIILFLFIVHLMMLSLAYQRGILKMRIHFLTSAFLLSLFMWFYQILKNEFSCFKPMELTSNPLMSGGAPGSRIHLADYGLSDRQINMLMDYMKTNASYKSLGEKYYISTSTVKKDFAEILKIFRVSRVEHLHILLIQYEIER